MMRYGETALLQRYRKSRSPGKASGSVLLMKSGMGRTDDFRRPRPFKRNNPLMNLPDRARGCQCSLCPVLFLCRTVLACCQCKLGTGYEGRELMKERDGVGEKEGKRGEKEIDDDCCPVNFPVLKSVTGISCLGTHE